MAEDLAGMLPDEEKRALQEWIAASEGHAALYEEIRKDFKEGRRRRLYTREEVEMQLAKFHRRNRNRKLWLIRRVGYAAAVVLVVGVAFCVSLYMKQPAEKMAAVEVTSVPEAGAQLILSSGELVDLDDRQEFAEENVRITRQHKELTYLNQDTVREREVRYNTLVISRGGDFKVTLADGTIVWLNSCTRLRYPLDFKGDVREVFLEGEAYFEVAKDAKHPFVVRTADVDVRVLGTRFNLSAYEEVSNNVKDVLKILNTANDTLEKLQNPLRLFLGNEEDEPANGYGDFAIYAQKQLVTENEQVYYGIAEQDYYTNCLRIDQIYSNVQSTLGQIVTDFA